MLFNTSGFLKNFITLTFNGFVFNGNNFEAEISDIFNSLFIRFLYVILKTAAKFYRLIWRLAVSNFKNDRINL